MKQKLMTGRLIVLLVGCPVYLFFTANVFATSMYDKVIDAPFAKNVIYIDIQLGFLIKGPKGWYGSVQSFDPSGEPLYHSFPPQVYVLYLKYFGKEERSHPYNPMFTVSMIRHDGDERSSLEELRYYANDTPLEDLITTPSESIINGKEWATYSFKLTTQRLWVKFHLIRKVYLLLHKNYVILLEATDTEEEYESDVELFDEVVSDMKFNDDYLELMANASREARGEPKK